MTTPIIPKPYTRRAAPSNSITPIKAFLDTELQNIQRGIVGSAASGLGPYAIETGEVGVRNIAWPLGNVRRYGAGSGSVSDALAFANCIETCAALDSRPVMTVPFGTYSIAGASPLPYLPDDLRILGDGSAVINFTGTGSLFRTSASARNEIAYLNIFGTFQPNTAGIRAMDVPGTTQDFHAHHCVLANFGDGSTGHGIWVQGDSQNIELGPQLYLYNLTSNIKLEHGCDMALIHHNNISTPPLFPNGPTRALDTTGTLGSGGQVFCNNVITTEGAGSVRIDGGQWALRDNETETLLSFTNSRSAAWELVSGFFTLDANVITIHGGGDYCLYFEDGVEASSEAHGTYSGFNVKAVRVNSSPGNVYGPSTADTGTDNLYTGDALGIVQATSGAGLPAFNFGYSDPPSGYGRNGPSWDGPINYIDSESGANNAFVCAAPMPLAEGLTLRVLCNHTLQVGANTLDYNGGGVVGIKSARNPGNDIGAAYAVGGVVTLLYDGTLWLDVSQ